jgi:PAS domain-containing protein
MGIILRIMLRGGFVDEGKKSARERAEPRRVREPEGAGRFPRRYGHKKSARPRTSTEERCLREFLRASPDALLCVGPRGRILLANPAAAASLGVESGRLEGAALARFLSRPDGRDLSLRLA